MHQRALAKACRRNRLGRRDWCNIGAFVALFDLAERRERYAALAWTAARRHARGDLLDKYALLYLFAIELDSRHQK